MASGGFGAAAGGDINPRRFVKQGTGAGQVLQAAAGNQVYGISQSGTRAVPYSTLADGLAAKVGEGLRVFLPGDVCDIEAGAAFSQGVRLKADADGKGIAVSANNDQYGAVALAPATAAGQFIPVRIEVGVHGA